MLKTYGIIVPTPYPVGPVNVYLIKNDPITLVETGPDTQEAAQTLEHMLDLLGCKLADIKRILISHYHPDHCGLARKIAAVSQAEVFIHPWDADKIDKQHDFYGARMPFFLETGIPADVFKEVMGDKDGLPEPSLSNVRTIFVKGGESLSFDGGQLRILHCPGHSPGHLCAYNPEQKHFFSGDFMLSHITPNPLMEPDPDRPDTRLPSLKQFMASLEVAEQTEIAMVFPGHGGVFNDYHSVIKVAREHNQEQFEHIKKLLQTGELNTYQLCMAIYPGLRKFGISLGLSEVLAHLDFMVEEGQIGCNKKKGINYYFI